MRRHRLYRIFEPASVAVVGASPRQGSVGYQVLHNLQAAGFKGAIFPVNRRHSDILGLTCFASVTDIGQAVDLVVMAIPAERIPGVMHQCVEARVGGVVVISAGFGEVGPLGRQLQDEIVELARAANIPLVGPNCLGVMRPRLGLNATFAHSEVRHGPVALVSQSGAFCTALLDAAWSGGRGFSAVASLGATADVDFGQVLDYLSLDAHTRSILLYIEGVNDARAFLSGLRAAARLKPVVVIKPGRFQAGRRAAVTHTGGHRGSDQVFNAALERAGAVRVNTVNELLAAANTLASGVRVTGDRLAILTNGGGPGVMAADRAAELEVPLAQLSDSSIEALGEILPPHWSLSDPVDLLGDAGPERYQRALEIVLADRNVDGVVVLLTPQGMTEPEACAEAVIAAARGKRKPVLACWMGQNQVREGRWKLQREGIPHFNSPEAAVNGFGYLAAYYRNQQKLLQAPPPLAAHRAPRVQQARDIIRAALGDERRHLDNLEARAVVAAFDIPVSACTNVTDPEEARRAAETLGLPVVLKINSPDISHKSDVGGVRLNVREADSVPAAYREIRAAVADRAPDARVHGVTVESMELRPHAREVVVAIERDPVFGPVIRFGPGGLAEDILTDTAVAIPPLSVFLCEELIQRSPAQRQLVAHRYLPAVDREALVELLMRASELACELPEIQRLILNPVLVDENGVLAVDAWLAVSPVRSEAGPFDHLAIHPYPPGMTSALTSRDGRQFLVRPIRPEDAAMERRFVDGLSSESRYFRFMYGMGDITPAMLARFTQIDYDREMALVVVENDDSEAAAIKAVARYVANPGGESCEFALAVADDMQRQGIGSELMRRLMEMARQRGFREMEGDVLAQNSKMLKLCRGLGFTLRRDPDDAEIMQVSRPLQSPAAAPVV
ncbi:bifunctional acetate--CoA ligase family protein/GNAT family N-acetyltransferase [Parahaliea aestuarii]|uniref:Bifunctional acetate--CoA ligase family protein/GNAT family N-acetyltransferase n=1 Tax=Parahaliea aestuarii TaxID=1852021 RepID=A0A5C8ZQC2_9GAMM|nr:bifunctional acetate--CoA ligase family protein/GNAT family N-acetyltransferase [Parahaliea aestuarii]TXS90004.1 bifunctional acetate--CoA ligase family protein/GNAT family N-acetyltransferase [Parahaliea aestuarii]